MSHRFALELNNGTISVILWNTDNPKDLLRYMETFEWCEFMTEIMEISWQDNLYQTENMIIRGDTVTCVYYLGGVEDNL